RRQVKQLATRDRRHVNVFQSLLIHARDGEGFNLRNRGSRTTPDLVLTSASGLNGRATPTSFPYPLFEAAILSALAEIDPAEILPREDTTRSRVDILKAKLRAVREQVSQLKEDLRGGYNKTLSALLREQEDVEERVANDLQEEMAKAAVPTEQAWQEL